MSTPPGDPRAAAPPAPLWDEHDQLVTGEAVALELPAASLGLRLVSGLIDVAVSFGVLLVGIVVGSLVAPDAALAAVAAILTSAVALVLGPAVLETLTHGRTLGKLATGLRTVRDDAGPISFHHAFVRHLVGVVEIWVLSGVPALVTAVVSSRGKRLGDLVAGTYVVRDRFRLDLPWPVQMPPHLAEWAAHADLAPLPDSLALAVRQVLARSGSLSPQAHHVLMGRIVGEVSRHVAPPPPAGTRPEDFLAAVAAERRTRDERRLWREADQRWRLTQRLG